MILNIEDLRKADIDDLTHLELDVLLQAYTPTELDYFQKQEIEHLYKICDSLVEYIQTKEHNVNFVAYVNTELEEIICSLDKEEIELEARDHKYFIQQNENGYTFEKMKEMLTGRIETMYNDFF